MVITALNAFQDTKKILKKIAWILDLWTIFDDPNVHASFAPGATIEW
jgi:hypothetical protein